MAAYDLCNAPTGPLQRAIDGRTTAADMMKVLVDESGLDVNASLVDDERAPLLLCAVRGNEEITRVLVAQPRRESEGGRSPMTVNRAR